MISTIGYDYHRMCCAFRGIVLIDSYGSLLQMLQHIDGLYQYAPDRLIVGVDFEGVELNRHGPLCLVHLEMHSLEPILHRF